MTFKELAIEILTILGRPATAKEIWDFAISSGKNKKITTKGKSPERTIGAQLYIDIKNKGVNSLFIQPAKGLFDLKSRSKNNYGNIPAVSSKTSSNSFDEKDMYKPFIEYIKKKFICQAKRIEETSTSIKGELEWTQPDIVGVNIPNFDNETENLIKNLQVYQCNIYSFELKKELTNSNLKKSYFQAVSNSSWATEGYLVVAKTDLNHLEEELKRLNNSFGIGIIEFNMDKPDESKIVLSAKTKEELDWKTIDKLVKSNTDFEEFIKGINNYITTGIPNSQFFD